MPTIVTLSGTAVAASTLAARSLRILEQISPGVAPTTDEYAVCLEALNAMLDSWRLERLMAISMLDESLTLVASQASYTIGLGGDLNTNRPVKIEGAYLVDGGGVSYGVKIIDQEEYANIGLKSSTSTLPNRLYYAPDMPLGNLWPYPVPSAGSTLHILTWTPQMAYTLISTTAYLAPGFEDAIVWNLALRIAPEFEKVPSPLVTQNAHNTKVAIKRANQTPTKINSGVASMINRVHSNILTNA